MSSNYLIIGGGIAGTTAAETLRKNDATSSIAIVSDEPYRLYSRILLSKPNFFLKKIPFDNVYLRTEQWYQDNRISLILGKQAVKLDPTAKTVTLNDNSTLQYDKLLLAVGGHARHLTIPGSDKTGIYYLRTLHDVLGIMDKVTSAKSAVTIGGGFVSFEACDLLRQAGLEVTLIIREKYFWDPLLDQTCGQVIEKAMESQGVKIVRQAEVAQITGDQSVSSVTLNNGNNLNCDLIIAGIGVACPFEWFQQAGGQTNKGILADQYLQTNLPDVFVAGDAAEFYSPILNEKTEIFTWSNAESQGKTAAQNMLGQQQPYQFVSFYLANGFGLTLAFTGDVHPAPDREVIIRDDPQKNSYTRLMLKDNKIVGGIMINQTANLSLVTKLIQDKVDVRAHKEELSNVQIPLDQIR